MDQVEPLDTAPPQQQLDKDYGTYMRTLQNYTCYEPLRAGGST